MRTRRAPAAAEQQGLFEEALIAIGLLLVVVALWSRVGALSLIVPGLVALWIGLPPRAAFVVKAEPSNGRTKE